MGRAARPGQSDGPADAFTPPDRERGRDEAPDAELDAFGINAGAVCEIRDRFQIDPDSVHTAWRGHFDGSEVDAPEVDAPEVDAPEVDAPELDAPDTAPPSAVVSPIPVERRRLPDQPAFDARVTDRHARVLRMIHSFRARGHRIAQSDPLGSQPSYFPELDPAHYGFGHDDLSHAYFTGDLPGSELQSLREIIEQLRATYCESIGVEYTHGQDP